MATNSIFQGVTTAPARDFVAQRIIETKSERVYMPCAGRFGAVESYLNHGGKKENLYTSDISLFSSMIGYLADPEKSVHDLGLELKGVFASDEADEVELVARVMLTLKFHQISDKNKYGQDLRKEIVKNQESYIQKIVEHINVLLQSLKGIHYDIADVFDVLNECKDDEKAALYLNVPTYKGGYSKMFSMEDIKWNEPNIAEFDPDRYDEMLDDLSTAKCKSFVYKQKSLDGIGENWKVVFAEPYSMERTDYILTNWSESKTFAVNPIKDEDIKKFPIYNDEDITEDTEIKFVKVNRETALYYRDMFVHKLGTTNAEVFYLMLIDGKVNTAMGLFMRDVYTGKSDYIGEVFGISKSSDKYMRLGKLFMLCLTCRETKEMLAGQYRFGVHNPRGIQTSSLTTFEEGKTDRSVMKLVFREKLKNGQFRVIYRADFADRKYKECVSFWLKKWGKKRRAKNV